MEVVKVENSQIKSVEVQNFNVWKVIDVWERKPHNGKQFTIMTTGTVYVRPVGRHCGGGFEDPLAYERSKADDWKYPTVRFDKDWDADIYQPELHIDCPDVKSAMEFVRYFD